MTYRDEFSEPQRGGILGILDAIGPKAGFFAVLIALSFLIGVVWNLYSADGDGGTGADVPIIRADNKPFKAVPDDPGGEKIAHRDSTIFSTLRSENAENSGRVENLFADEENEEPMHRSQLFAGLNAEKEVELSDIQEQNIVPSDDDLDKSLEEDVEQVIEEETIEEKAEAQENSEIDAEAEEIVQEALNALPTISVKPTVKPTPKPQAVKKSVQKTPVKTSQKVQPIVPPSEKIEANLDSVLSNATDNKQVNASPSTGNYYVQLGSVRSASTANSEWRNIQSKHSVLAGMSHRVETADLGAKGVFYRIQAGPVTKARADAICREIKKKTPSGCLVKKK